MRFQGWMIAAALLAGCLASGQSAPAQDVYRVSNADLLRRIDELERRQAAVGASYDVGATTGGGGSCCDSCCNTGCNGGGWYGVYESVVVQPYFTRDYAFHAVDTSTIDIGREYSFDWDLEYSPRFEIGYIDPCCGHGWRGRYWTFDADTTLSANDPDEDYYAAFSQAIGIDDDDEIIATHALEMDVVDLEYLYRDCYWTYSGGLRYVKMEQFYRAESESDSFLGQHDWEGIGPTVALEYMRPVSCNLAIFTRARGSILFGESTLFAADLEGADTITRAQDDLLTNGEIQIGVDWRRSVNCRTLFVTAALEAQYWLSAGSGSPGLNTNDDDINYHDEAAQNADLGFFGFTLGLGMEY